MKQILLYSLVLFSTLLYSQKSNVNDFENILTQEEINSLNDTINTLTKNLDYKILIVTFENYPYPIRSISKFSESIYYDWNIEKEKVILILLSKNLKTSNVTINFDDITHEKLNDVFTKYMIPEFSKQKFYDGLLKGVGHLARDNDDETLQGIKRFTCEDWFIRMV